MMRHSTSTRFLTFVLKAVVLALLIPFGATGALAQITQPISYEKLLSEAAQRKGDPDAQVQTILNILGGGAQQYNAGEVLANIKRNWPKADPDAPIRVLPEIRSSMVTDGDDFERLMRVGKPLLRFCWLEERVRLILFKSEVPVVAFIYPNVLTVSTRTMALFNDDQLSAACSHEVMHLLANKQMRQARDKHDNQTMRMLELFYDAGAAAIIVSRGSKIGSDPRSLIAAYSKMNAVLEIEFQQYQDGTVHPPLKVRQQLNDALYRLFVGAPTVAAAPTVERQ